MSFGEGRLEALHLHTVATMGKVLKVQSCCVEGIGKDPSLGAIYMCFMGAYDASGFHAAGGCNYPPGAGEVGDLAFGFAS